MSLANDNYPGLSKAPWPASACPSSVAAALKYPTTYTRTAAARVDRAVRALERRISPYEGAGGHDGLVIAEFLAMAQFDDFLLPEEAKALCSLPEMAWATPESSTDEVDAAGDVLINPRGQLWENDAALAIINNWRSSHSFPLNTFQVGLRTKGKMIDANCLVAQRIKRLSSIEQKLHRFDWLKLSEMQDIGGCRAVVSSVRRVDELVNIYKESDVKHRLVDEDDYVREPKRSGYRGVHLIYRYYSDRKETYNDLKIEMQFRSPLQHAWATAVETVGTFIHQALKSSRGEKEWLRFFALMGSAIALRERTAPVPGTPTIKKELVQELRQRARQLDVENRLRAYGATLKTLEQPGAIDAQYFLLVLDPDAKSVTITGYKTRQLELASRHYLEAEQSLNRQSGADAVLVSVESLGSLRRAYPNYFLDTRVFINALKQALER